MAGKPRDPYRKLLRMPPWEKAGMSLEEYGHLLAWVAAHPALVQRMILAVAEAAEAEGIDARY